MKTFCHFFAIIALTASAFVITCSTPDEIDNPDQIIVVQAFLTPGQDARIELSQTLPPESYYEGRQDPLRAARVVVSTGDMAVVLDEEGSLPGTYTASKELLPVTEGETYYLEVTHDDRLVRASTTVPVRATVTQIAPGRGDTITYFQPYGDIFGDLNHPGEFFWNKSADAAGYVVIVEAVNISSLPVTADILTVELDSLLARRTRLDDLVSTDSLETLDREIDALRQYFNSGISRLSVDGDTSLWLRDREEADWAEQEGKDWSEGRLWRERRADLYRARVIDYWVPADSTRSDFWWLGVRFEGEYSVTLQSADRNYFDYYTTTFNGNSGADADRGPLFHVDGGTGVFGSYSQDSFRVFARRGD